MWHFSRDGALHMLKHVSIGLDDDDFVTKLYQMEEEHTSLKMINNLKFLVE